MKFLCEMFGEKKRSSKLWIQINQTHMLDEKNYWLLLLKPLTLKDSSEMHLLLHLQTSGFIKYICRYIWFYWNLSNLLVFIDSWLKLNVFCQNLSLFVFLKSVGGHRHMKDLKMLQIWKCLSWLKTFWSDFLMFWDGWLKCIFTGEKVKWASKRVRTWKTTSGL